MARRYTPEDLLHLRQSPLCVKPKDLPPLEEWMGQAIDDKSKRQSNGRGPREGQVQGSGTAAKPPLALDFSRQHGRQTSNGELGLKGALFSPGIRDSAKDFVSSRMAQGPLSPRGEQPIGMGRFGMGEREQGTGRDKATTRFSALRASKDEGESWATGRSARRQEVDESDRPTGRRGEREHDNVRDNGRESHRRYGSDAATENIRNRDWRNSDKAGARLANREWNHGQEQDPEWMVEEKPAGGDQKKTVQDFEAWKKAMRAEDAAAKGERLPTIQSDETHVQPVPKKTIETPLALETGEDKFFGLWGLPSATPHSEATGHIALQPTAPAKGGKSKFTNFFAAPEPPPQMHQPMPPLPERFAPTPPQSGLGQKLPPQKAPATADEQGFQRILDMLKAKSPAVSQKAAAFQAPPRHRTPPREATSTSATPPLVSPRPKSHGVQNFLNPQSPGNDPNSQFLLSMLRPKDSEPPPTLQMPQYGGPLVPQANHSQRAPYHPQSPVDFPPGFDKLNPSAHQLNQRRHNKFDSQLFDDAPFQQQQQPRQHQQQHGPPPGFQGFPHNMNAPNFPPGLGPMPGQGGFPARNQMGAPPPGFGPGGPGPGGPVGPAPFRGMPYPPGFGGMPNVGGLHLGEDHGPGPGPGPPPGFSGGPPGGLSRPPPGFQGRGPPGGMAVSEMFDGRRGEQGVYGSRD